MSIESAIKQALAQHRDLIEQTYMDICAVYELQSVKDPETKLSSKQEVSVLEGIPCKLSIQSSPQTTMQAGAAQTTQMVKLFLSSETQIKAGSKIIVLRDGNSYEYKRSGKPAVYNTHQVIELESFKGWA